MLNKLCYYMICMISIISVVSAGPGGPVCMVPCVEGCAVLAAPIWPACFSTCVVTCGALCMSEDMYIMTKELSDKPVFKKIVDIHRNDIVLTEKNGEYTWTRVLTNYEHIGKFNFIRVTTNYSTMEITDNHVVVIMNNDSKTAIAAKNIKRGDTIPSFSLKGKFMYDTVLTVEHFQKYKKYILSTVDGTVMLYNKPFNSSGLLVTTICENYTSPHTTLDEKLEQWQKDHILLF